MSKCVACGTALTESLAIFGSQLPSAIYNEESTDADFLHESSLDLTICPNSHCKLVQLAQPVDLSYVYEHYPYQTGTTSTMSDELREFSSSALQNVALLPGDVILDIGGNDGTLLSDFANSSQVLINIDAASGVKQSFSSPNYIHKQGYFAKEIYLEVTSQSPKVIFSSAMFYQLANPDKFCADVSSIMSNETIFYLQMTYLGSMYKNRIFDNVVHEHITYFSLFSLENLLSRHGLRVFDAGINDLYGGTLRVGIVREESELAPNDLQIEAIRLNETANGVNSNQALFDFGSNFESWKKNASVFIQDLIYESGPLVGFGASTKGNMLLQALGLTSAQVSRIIDNNDKKIGTWTTKTLIPITSEDSDTIINRPVLLLPYYYLHTLSKVIAKMVPTGLTVKLVTLLPEPTFALIEGEKKVP